MAGSVPRWVLFAAGSAALYCLVIIGVVLAYNTSVLNASSYAEITGGGFIYNYRIADIRSGITVGVRRDLPAGTHLVAELETPDGMLELNQDYVPGHRNYVFETPPLTGVEPERSYMARLKVVDAVTGAELERHEKALKTGIAPRIMPDKPLTIGPGYFPNPDLQPAPAASPSKASPTSGG